MDNDYAIRKAIKGATKTHLVDFLVADVNLNFLGSLDLEGQVLNGPVLAAAVDIRFNDQRVRDSLLAAATPHLATAQQHLAQVFTVERTAGSIRVASRH